MQRRPPIRSRAPSRLMAGTQARPEGSPRSRTLHYDRHFISPSEREEILAWISTLHPIWEQRFSEHRPPPAGDQQRGLLRPVYWLGNWQFACLDYYHPPKGIRNRCVAAEEYPAVLKKIIAEIESEVRQTFSPKDVPEKWHLNTCLINFYGDKYFDDTAIDRARVGEGLSGACGEQANAVLAKGFVGGTIGVEPFDCGGKNINAVRNEVRPEQQHFPLW